MHIISTLMQKGLEFSKVATTNGGEWAGPCPVCGGTDRFRVWPNKPGGARFWCRQCDKGGDLIEYYRWAEKMGYRAACEAAGVEAKPYDRPSGCPTTHRRRDLRPPFEPSRHEPPCAAWSAQAEKFADGATAALLENPAALRRLHEKRGISADTARRFRLGINHSSYFRPREAWGLPHETSPRTGKPKRLWIPRGLIVPSLVGGEVMRIKVRRPRSDLRTERDPRYYHVPGGCSAPMLVGDNHRALVVVESELDALLIAQEAADLAGAVALGSAQNKPDARLHPLMVAAASILVALDFDGAGEKASRWWLNNYPQAVRWPVPCGKDPGGMHRQVDVRAWVLAGLPDHLSPPQMTKGA